MKRADPRVRAHRPAAARSRVRSRRFAIQGSRGLAAAACALALAGCAVIPIPVPFSLPRPTPIADHPINLEGACFQTEDDGFREEARLVVRDNQVTSLAWQLQVGRAGTCRFDQADFRQTKRRPHIELLALDGSGCRLMIWQQPRRVTLAHAGCENRCTPGIYDKAWPVMFDPATGRCARP